MKKISALAPGLVLAGSLMAAPSTVIANGPSIYGGGGIGYFRLNDDDFLDDDDDFKDNRTGWRAQVGAQFNPILSIEGGYVDFGNLNDGPLRFSSDGGFAAALVHLPLGTFAPFAKIGQLWWDVDREGPSGGGLLTPPALSGQRSSGNDTFYGVGVRIGEGPGLQLRLEYDRMEVDNADIDMGSINLQYRF